MEMEKTNKDNKDIKFLQLPPKVNERWLHMEPIYQYKSQLIDDFTKNQPI